AEWEYAARAGTDTPFHWGDTADISFANIRGKYPRESATSSELEDPDHYGTTPVGSYPPNALGLYDMHGNVAEWCLDVHNARLPGGEQVDWVRLGSGSRRAVRGGGWETNATRARAASRTESMTPKTRSSSLGFRLCLAPALSEE
ncbi:MAG: SUMF1/EgtB/PvdO family nonheme iron enzyme, partial [Verrucomicrobiota bacterium]